MNTWTDCKVVTRVLFAVDKASSIFFALEWEQGNLTMGLKSKWEECRKLAVWRGDFRVFSPQWVLYEVCFFITISLHTGMRMVKEKLSEKSFCMLWGKIWWNTQNYLKADIIYFCFCNSENPRNWKTWVLVATSCVTLDFTLFVWLI